MFKTIRNALFVWNKFRLLFPRYSRMMQIMSVLAGYEEASITFTNMDAVTIKVFTTIGGQRVRLFENTTDSLERGLIEAVIELSKQGA